MAIVVTGGSSGIGRAIAEHFAAPGVDVVVNYANDQAAADETAAAIEAKGGKPLVVRADMGTLDGIRTLAEAVRSEVGKVDQLVHSAASTASGPLLGLDPEAYEQSIRVNGTALVHLCRELGDLLDRGSTVFYVTSRGARYVIPGYGSLGTAKALAEHVVRYLAVELAPRGIRVNSISPGAVDTKAFRNMFPDTYEQRLAAAAAANPSGRGLRIEECGALVELLASPACEMVTGQTVTIDGGASL